ncbi:MAG: DMT family transporter [Clostridia bacterium]|nr:DMT family transporter [Clostridia bacterium]
MIRHYLSMIFVNVMWGLSFMASKLALSSGFSVMMLAAMRYAVAVVCLLPFALRDKRSRLRKKDIHMIFLSGFTGITLYYYFEYSGISRTSTVNTSLIIASVPMMTMLAEAVIDHKRMTAAQLIGSLVSLCGVGAIVLGSRGEEASLVGDLFIVGCAVVWVIYIFVSRGLRQSYSSIAMNAWQAVAALITLVPLAFTQPCDLSAVTWEGWAAMLVLAVVCSSLCYVLYGQSLSEMSPLASAIFINLQPFVAIIAGALFLGERITPVGLLGGVMIIASIFIVSLPAKKPAGDA